MQTTLRVTPANRDALAKFASERGLGSMDEALATLLFEHESHVALARLAADPQAWADYVTEARTLAEVDVAVRD